VKSIRCEALRCSKLRLSRVKRISSRSADGLVIAEHRIEGGEEHPRDPPAAGVVADLDRPRHLAARSHPFQQPRPVRAAGRGPRSARSGILEADPVRRSGRPPRAALDLAQVEARGLHPEVDEGKVEVGRQHAAARVAGDRHHVREDVEVAVAVLHLDPQRPSGAVHLGHREPVVAAVPGVEAVAHRPLTPDLAMLAVSREPGRRAADAAPGAGGVQVRGLAREGQRPRRLEARGRRSQPKP